ncbi:MAG: hypothetical protein ACE5LV_05565, partial [Candidatus Aminicenantales bacterium]
MRKIPVSGFLILLLAACGLSLLTAVYRQAETFTMARHKLEFSWLPFVLLSLGFFIFLLLLWYAVAFLERRILARPVQALLRENVLVFLPLGFFLLSPLLLRFYLGRDDLRVRLNLFVAGVVASCVLALVFRWGGGGRWKRFSEACFSRFSRLPGAAKILVLFLSASLVYHLGALSLVKKGLAYSGDEPYYLLTAHSLYQDGDINLAKNYEDGDYFFFYPRELYPKLRLRAYARFGRKGTDYVYPISQPGTSVLVLPYYWLSQRLHGRNLIYVLKVSLVLWAVLLGLQVYLFVRDFWRSEKLALGLWFLYAFSAPVLFYAIHVYPEVPIAFFSLYVFRKVRTKKPLSFGLTVFLGFLLALFPWFGLKYNVVLWPLSLVGVYFLLKIHRAGARILGFLVPPVVSSVLFLFYTRYMYGTFYPMAIYEGVLTPEKIRAFRETVLHIPLMLRLDSLLDYFLDQRDGLLLYSPLYFYAFLGAVEAFRRSKKDFVAFLVVIIPYLGNYAFLSHRQGHSPQGRVLTSISWIGILLVGYFLVHNRKKIYTVLFWFFAASGFAVAVLLFLHPGFLYQPTTHQFTFRGGAFFVFLSNLYIYLPAALPSFIKVNNLGYWPNYVWLAAVCAFVLGYMWRTRSAGVRAESRRFSFPPSLTVVSVLSVFVVMFVLFPRHVLLFPEKA